MVMTDEANIPISPVAADAPGGAAEAQTIGGGVVAILHEVEHLLARLADTGEVGAIDLHSLPMAPSDYESLREALGEGEVAASLGIGSPSHVRETGFPGAWWVQHCDPSGEVAAEYLEIATVPEILAADLHDVRQGTGRLKNRITQMKDLTNDEG
jgi:hydrogenase-1 operon protein HyaF